MSHVPSFIPLCVEPLAPIIRTLPKFSGIIYLEDPNTFLDGLQQALEQYRKISGLKINQSKSEIYSINIDAKYQKKKK